MIEINHFLDIQREELEDIQALFLRAMASPVPPEGTLAKTEKISELQTAVPEVMGEESEDSPAADTVPSVSSASDADTKSTASSETEYGSDAENDKPVQCTPELQTGF